MDEKSTFAIVDLETTAPFKEGGHIIQIGISFVQNWKIINNFQTMVNPGVRIPPQIVELTGIQNADVQDAPYFEDLALMIHEQLAGTVFVAHNVHYDFPYLNGEFSRIKMRRLRLESVDTVQLAQILFPTMPSYKLDELVENLGITLPRHHRADQDAYATAQLFLKLHDRMASLSQNTLKNLSASSSTLIGNTENLFSLVKGQPKFKGSHYKELDLLQVHRAKADDLHTWLTGKRRFLTRKTPVTAVLRPRQESFANIFLSKLKKGSSKTFSVFSRPRFGKSNAYLLLAEKLAAKGAKVLIIEEDPQRKKLVFEKSQLLMPEKRSLFANPISRKDFISLSKFREALAIEDSPTKQLAKLRLLVWLTETKSGNLNEIVNGFPEALYSLFADQTSPDTFDYFKAGTHDYEFPDIAITDLASFLVTKHEFLSYYDYLIFDIDKGVSDLADLAGNIDKTSIMFTQAKDYLKNWYSSREFPDLAATILSLKQ
ncbi:exonuclease domain-containing protein [Oenococcus sp.]|uniref:exonuclease domain-containing protein n=1 Tax=Oenococcus sp. TaxID=1979414 RepID=UPI0039E9D789